MTANAGRAPRRLDPARIARGRRGGARRWTLLVGLILFAVYAAGTGIPSEPGSDLRAGEAHILLTTQSIVEDGDADLANQYRQRAWRDLRPGALTPSALAVEGRLIEPHGVVFPALLAPAYALGGRIAVELFLALIAALGFAVATALARRLVPDPWASASVLAIGLAPPAVLGATTISPTMTCATLIAAAALLALRVRDNPLGGPAVGCAVLLAPVIWLSGPAAIPAAVVSVALVRWLGRRRRAWTGIAATEILLISVIVYITVNDRLQGGLTAYASSVLPHGPTGAAGLGDYLERLTRLWRLLVTPPGGILLYGPVLLLCAGSIALLWRSRRDRLARAFPQEGDIEVSAGLLAAVCAAAFLTAVLLIPATGARWPGETLAVALPCAAALASWAMRRWVRIGAVLALVGIALSGWILVAARVDDGAGVAPPRGPVPWATLR
ncbi:unannotated protein [freshwater metagenome]|uniref:Unannotated protein n=1 Tax=freshwater metagenome TaxID=449393 RepID=A0A6J7DJD5_9ZZZZ|nr:hypothetical protein [Actinomycetota bacterium]